MPDGLVTQGFAFVQADDMRRRLEAHGALSDWDTFADSWNDLHTDTFMADKGRYRKRRYAVYSMTSAGGLTREPHQPHYQTVDYNHLNGGVERWFEPILPAVSEGGTMTAALRYGAALYGGMAPDVNSWHVEAHQFRIEAQSGKTGKPTPEGMHRDGVDYVLVMMVRRQNIQSGETSIHDLEHKHLGSFTLTHPLDTALVDDKRVFHGVTPVMPIDAAQPAYRDVLVLTYRRQ